MKKAILLALLFIVAFPTLGLAETRDCRQSFDLGNNDAERLHGSKRWYWIGVVTGFSALGVYFAVDSYIWEQGGRYDPVTGDEPPTGPMPFICSVAVLGAPVLPARLLPRRAKILPPDKRSNLECYRDGYTKRVRRNNTRSLLYGELTAVGVVLLFSVLVANAMY